MNRLTGVERVVSRIAVDENGCHRWQSTIDQDGYGRFANQYAHRLSYETFVGPILPGLTIDHLCRVRDCVNPFHLEAVSRRENTLRGDTITGRLARKTECVRGHKFDHENTGWDSRGHRRCLACARKGS